MVNLYGTDLFNDTILVNYINANLSKCGWYERWNGWAGSLKIEHAGNWDMLHLELRPKGFWEWKYWLLEAHTALYKRFVSSRKVPIILNVVERIERLREEEHVFLKCVLGG